MWHGELPYRDFAFTQAPLTPYVFGLPQVVLGPSLLLGRCTAAAIWLATAFGGVRFVARRAGPRAAAAAALVLAAQPALAAAFVTIKTYGLLAALFVATAAVTTSQLRPTRRLPLATFLAGCATLTRISALPFSIVVLAWSLGVARSTRERLAAVGGAALSAAPLLALYAADPVATRFGLWRYHQLTVDDSTRDRIEEAVRDRIPGLADFYLVYALVVLTLVAATLARPEGRAWMRAQSGAVAAGLGMVGFVGAHLLAGEWHLDYAFPAVPGAVLVSAMLAKPLFDDVERAVTRLLAAFVASASLLLLVATGVIQGLDWRGGSPLARIHEVAELVHDRTDPGDRVLALAAQTVQVESGRDPIDGVSLAQFSYVDVDDADATRLDVVNAGRLLDVVERAEPAIIVLTEFDFGYLTRLGLLSDRATDPAPLLAALEANYDEIDRFPSYSKPGLTAIVYERTDSGR